VLCACVQVKYVCSSAGCKYFDVDSKSFVTGLQMGEVLVLTRTSNTVRAVEMQSGVEKYVHTVYTHGSLHTCTSCWHEVKTP